MNKTVAKLLTAAVLAASLATTAVADSKPIMFAKGKSSAVVSGSVKGGDDMDYVLRAKAGQTMNVDFSATKGAAFFNVLAPNSGSEALFVGSRDGNHYSGALPSDGEYTIRVYLMGAAKDSGKPVKFTIKVGIPADK
jgi:hypothetical protein